MQRINAGQHSITLEDMLPHREGMLLVEEVLEVDHNHAVTASTANLSWPLAAADGIKPLILVELAAQTAGVCNGWDRIMTKGLDSEKKGWLVGVKQARFHLPVIPLGSRIITRSENSHKYEQLLEVTSTQMLGDTVIGTVTFQLIEA